MALRRIPGSRNYKADDTGFKQILNSSKMSAASVDAAQRIAGNAEAVGRGTYTAAATPVRAGWANETRAGATVSASPDNDWRDTRDRVLLRVLDAMTTRGRT